MVNKVCNSGLQTLDPRGFSFCFVFAAAGAELRGLTGKRLACILWLAKASAPMVDLEVPLPGPVRFSHRKQRSREVLKNLV